VHELPANEPPNKSPEEPPEASPIELLDHRSHGSASRIHDLFQCSYAIEAELIGVTRFPPLERSLWEVQSARSRFIGQWIGSELAAVLEYSSDETHLCIDSLVVHPQYFRRGLASRMLQSLLAQVAWETADVETAAGNAPAIALYEKFGFYPSRRWTTGDGIAKVQLLYNRMS
jgi:GNAT superfamily N-acetyltransferase